MNKDEIMKRLLSLESSHAEIFKFITGVTIHYIILIVSIVILFLWVILLTL